MTTPLEPAGREEAPHLAATRELYQKIIAEHRDATGDLTIPIAKTILLSHLRLLYDACSWIDLENSSGFGPSEDAMHTRLIKRLAAAHTVLQAFCQQHGLREAP